MVSLSDAIPIEHFRNLFVIVRKKIIARNLVDFYTNDPEVASTVNLFVWDEGVNRGVVKNGDDMRIYHPHDLAKAYSLTKNRLGEEPFKEIYCVKYYNEHSKQDFLGSRVDIPFAEIDLVECYPGDIHIADVTLLDLTKPVRDMSEISPRSHKGLHVFPLLLDGLMSVAKQKGLERLSLVAASKAAHDTFARYGFQPTDTPVSQYAFQNMGFGHAMALKVR